MTTPRGSIRIVSARNTGRIVLGESHPSTAITAPQTASAVTTGRLPSVQIQASRGNATNVAIANWRSCRSEGFQLIDTKLMINPVEIAQGAPRAAPELRRDS